MARKAHRGRQTLGVAVRWRQHGCRVSSPSSSRQALPFYTSQLRQLTSPSSISSPVAIQNISIMALRFVPSASHPSRTVPVASAPSAPGLPDLLRSSTTATPSSSTTTTTTTTSGHALESRLLNWRQQQDTLKMETLRRTYGIAEPVRRGMELKIAAAGEWRPACLGRSANVHVDILRGTDGTVDGWEDVFGRGEEGRNLQGFHVEMENRLRMGGPGGL